MWKRIALLYLTPPHCSSDEGTARNKAHKRGESEKMNLLEDSSTGDNNRDSHLWCSPSDVSFFSSICSWSE